MFESLKLKRHKTVSIGDTRWDNELLSRWACMSICVFVYARVISKDAFYTHSCTRGVNGHSVGGSCSRHAA